MEKTRATIIRRLPLTETSLIVHWCSDDRGLLKTVAKGARRSGSPFGGRLDLFFRCEIVYAPARRSDLHTLREVSVLSHRAGIRTGYLHTLCASYFCGLIDRIAEPETPISDLADLLDRGLDFLDRQAPSLRGLDHFESELARLLGLQEPGRPAHECIEATFGRLPKQRDELQARLAAAN